MLEDGMALLDLGHGIAGQGHAHGLAKGQIEAFAPATGLGKEKAAVLQVLFQLLHVYLGQFEMLMSGDIKKGRIEDLLVRKPPGNNPEFHRDFSATVEGVQQH